MMAPRQTTELTVKEAAQAAVSMLARREHSAGELTTKLAKKGFDTALIADALAELQQRGLQSDSRFAESYVRGRAAKGYGAARIELELRMRGVDADVATSALRDIRDAARRRVAQVRRKKFGESLPSSAEERARQARFLLQRGFSHEQVRSALRGEEEF